MPESTKVNNDDLEYGLEFGRFLASPPLGEEVVISGIAGNFPESDNMYELQYNLYNHIDMVTEDERRWKKGDPKVPQRTGKIKSLSKFDAAFFGCQAKEVDAMCPMLRCQLERTYEAIVDAGINPKSLKGSRTGVYMGSIFNETEKALFMEKKQDHGYAITGNSRCFSASRISYWLGVNGPAFTIDSACSSSMYALQQAYEDLRSGVIDYAIVGASNLCLEPSMSLQFFCLGVLSVDGRVKAFDQNADGYVRSETVATIFLQRAKDAKRIYGTVVHSKYNCDGYKPEGITFPATEVHKQLFEEFYKECNIDPATLDYVEAHATGTKVGDPEELNAIEKVFCANRTSPLPIGSVKSNLGHSEPGSGICAIAKVILAMETGLIAANLNFKTPKESVPGLKNGKFKVVTENTPFSGELIGINSFGFGGANSHLLLRAFKKVKVNEGAPKDALPRLVVASGRTEEAVNAILDDVKSRPVDVEFISLLHEIHAINTPGHLYRGYILLTPGDDKPRHVQYYGRDHRPLWLVFVSSGDNWIKIGRTLLQIPIFVAVIEKCNRVLKPHGIDLLKIITTNDGVISGNIIKKSVVSLAIQLGFVDIISCVGMTADGLLGHRNGELACAYADGTLTAEQAILMAYYHALGLSRGSNQDLLQNFQQIISSPKLCSNHWVNLSKNGLISAEYFAACLLDPPPLEKTICRVPDKALVVGLDMEESVYNWLLTKLKNKKIKMLHFPSNMGNEVTELLILLGRLYEAGIELQLKCLYPSIQYPVSRGTPMISPLIRWNHSTDWQVYSKIEKQEKKSERLVVIRPKDYKSEFYKGHVIDGRNLFPATGYLLLVWETFSQNELESVVFEDVRFERATTLPEEDKVEFIISIQRHNGQFEVVEGGVAIVTGCIRKMDDVNCEMLLGMKLPVPPKGNDIKDLNARDIYKELRLRGYNYSGVFRGLVSVDNIASTGIIRWNENWVGFMDTMLQMTILSKDTRSLYVPTYVDKIVIDMEKHFAELGASAEENLLPIYSWKIMDIVRAGGIEIQRLGASPIPRRKPLGDPVLEQYQFLPHVATSTPTTLNLEQILRMCVHIVLENHLGIKVRVFEVAQADAELFSPHLVNILGDLPLIQADITVLTDRGGNVTVNNLGPGIQVLSQDKLPADQTALLVVGHHLMYGSDGLKGAVDTLVNDGCILLRERIDSRYLQCIEQNNLEVIVDRIIGKERILLLRKKQPTCGPPLVINIVEKSLTWLPSLQAALHNTKAPQRIVLVAEGEPISGILGLFNCIRKEPGGDLVRCFLILDSTAPRFDVTLPLYSKQLEKDLAVNVLQDGTWGSYRHLLLESSQKVEAIHGYSNILLRGDLSTLTWLEGPLNFMNEEEKRDVFHIYYSALNFRDIMLGTGKLSPDAVCCDRTNMDILQGIEFSGRDEMGRRIMGMSVSGSLATIVKTSVNLTWQVPDSWSLEDAATVPVVYATAIYALQVEGNIQPGESVLIHAGSGGVGQAAINYCLFHGCTVYTTVGTQEKREFIKKHFPQLTDDHIGCSRDTSFEQFIMKRTEGRGVDLVLNSLAEEKLQASIRCLTRGGRFLEIGKYDMSKNNPLGLEMFAKDQSFHSIMIDNFFHVTAAKQLVLNKVLQEAISEGSVKPLVRTIYDTERVEEAFRFMAAGKHIGKVLIKIRPEEDELLAKPKMLTMEVIPRFYCNPNLSYIILGGLGGFGLELADWLVLRGVRKLVLVSRRGISTGYQSSRIRIWRSYGTVVHISTADVSTEQGVRMLLTEANNIAPVGGIFNLAVTLRDALFGNQTEEAFKESFKGKAHATHHLDALSRQLCPRLEYFVVFSSVSCGRGNAGQTNYGMSNSIMERICEARVRDGLPAVAIQWGAVGEVGLVADMQEEQQELVIGGTLQQRISSCLEVLDTFLKQPHPVVASMVVAEKRASGGKYGNIVDCVANILGIRDLKTVNTMLTITELGMDSMMAVEIKQVIEHEFEIFLTPQEIRNLTFKQLQELGATDSTQSENKGTGEQQASEFAFQLIGDPEAASKVILPLSSLNTRLRPSPVFFIPGMEGVATDVQHLSKNITAPCVALQLCYHNTGKTVVDMATHLLSHMQKQFVLGTSFALVGHSFGGLVALELAALLEAEGCIGHIFLLDAAPEFLSRLSKEHLLKNVPDSEEALQISILCRILNLVAPSYTQDIHEFASEMKRLGSWEDQVERVLDFTPEQERDYQRAIVNAIFTHVKAAFRYSWPPGRMLQSHVILIRPNISLIKMEGDCGLSKFCQKSVDVHFVDGDHTTMLKTPMTAKIINDALNE